MKKNNTSGSKIDHVIIMFAINALLLSVFMESLIVEVNGLPYTNTTLIPNTNTTLIPATNATENETGQNGTIASFPGSLDSDRRHMPLV